jgi:trk system potassium uptake protein TrkH
VNGLFEKHKFRRLNQVQYIACGFLLMILIGTALLLLPISTRAGQKTGVLEALFTATSASCVTGLVVYDTYTHWSLFGQLILITLIQIGGLGFITIGVGFAMAFRKRIGLRQRDLLKESVNAFEIGGIIRLWKEIMIGTVFFEGVGAVLLSTRFIPEFGVAKGIYYSIFHSISAFCNAGFDLMGTKEAYSSFSDYVTDPVVNITLCLLITIGSLGFIVWKDLWKNKFHWKRYMLHTKIVMTVTIILILGGTLLMYEFEKDNTISEFNFGGKLIASLFGAVTPRTAGFNTVDTAALTPAAKLLTIMFMFIGGSPGSTAGGIKTTTITVILVYVFSNLHNSSGCNLFKRRISDDVIKKASMVFCLNLMLALVSCVIILSTSHLAMDDILFEVFSAISTVGMTTGVTRDLNTVGRIVIIFLMYCGRIGSMTFALSLIQRSSQQATTYPAERITIG